MNIKQIKAFWINFTIKYKVLWAVAFGNDGAYRVCEEFNVHTKKFDALIDNWQLQSPF